MEHLEQMITELTSTVNVIQVDVQALQGKKTSIPSLETNIANCQDQQKSDSIKIKLLSVIVIRQETQIEKLISQVELLQKENKKSNFFIEGILETEKEETHEGRIEVIKDFLKNQMEIEETITVKQAYRIGHKDPRVFKVVLANNDDKNVIFSNLLNLKGKKNTRKKLFFVNDDLTAKEKELKDYYRDLCKENEDKDENQKLQNKLCKGKLFTNNKIIIPQIAVPKARDILTLDDQELENLHGFRTHEAGEHQEDNSDFYCYCSKAKNVNEVEAGLTKMKIKFGNATHIAAAYRFEDANGPFNQGYIDDGEEGAGRAILKVLQSKESENMATYIARYYGNKHLGSCHFKIYSSLAKQAAQSFKIRLDKLSHANRLRCSGSQLSQLSQLSDMMQDNNDDAATPNLHQETDENPVP